MIFLFLQEIDIKNFYQTLYYIIVALIGFVSSLAVLTVAVMTIKKYLYRPFFEHFISPVVKNRQQLIELVDSVQKLEKHNEDIAKEIKINGGNSIKDSVVRIEADLAYAIHKLKHWDELSGAALFEIDEKGSLSRANRCLCDLLDCVEADLLYKNWIIRIMPNEQERVLREWNQAIENKCPLDSFQTVIKGTYSQGSSLSKRNILQVRVQATPRLDKNKELLGFFGWMSKVESEND